MQGGLLQAPLFFDKRVIIRLYNVMICPHESGSRSNKEVLSSVGLRSVVNNCQERSRGKRYRQERRSFIDREYRFIVRQFGPVYVSGACEIMKGFFFCFKNDEHVFDVDNSKKYINGIVAFIAEKKLATVIFKMTFQGNKYAEARTAQIIKPVENKNDVAAVVFIRYVEDVLFR